MGAINFTANVEFIQSFDETMDMFAIRVYECKFTIELTIIINNDLIDYPLLIYNLKPALY